MRDAVCIREDELLDALARGLVGPELEGHVAGCESCGELRLVAAELLDDRSHAMAEARVPTAGSMWWRMQMRYRQEAEARARQSLLIGQAATLLVAISLVLALFGSDLLISLHDLAVTVRLSTPLLLALGTWLIVAPIAGWVAVRQK